MTTLSLTTYNGNAFNSTLPADAALPSFVAELEATNTNLKIDEFLGDLFEAIVNEYHDDDESIISHILTDVSDPCSYMSWSEFYEGSDLGYADDTEWFHLYARVYGERVDIRSASFISFLSAEQSEEERSDFAIRFFNSNRSRSYWWSQSIA